jgi:antitoxin (DNA-binding transcriptional repressor) of toxin-antitoxin stability system
MKTISLRQLHEKTGQWVRQVHRHGEIVVTDRGAAIARITPETLREEPPYFARRVLLPAFRQLVKTGRLSRGTDSAVAISEDREDREL